ncbi:MAG: hypothetical protein K2Q12_06700 [Rickettsiales bacterium]|nr:hypothetical protein [Rickettsiales bacterium]
MDAKANTGLVFSRDSVYIETTVTLPVVPEEKTSDDTIEESSPPALKTENRRYFFDTEIRPEESLKQEWFHSLANMQEGHATMVVFSEAAPRAVPLVNIYKAIDVLILGDDGSILAILPSIILATQQKIIRFDVPVKAFMFLRAAEADRLHLKPKDMAEHPVFTKKPTVIQ